MRKYFIEMILKIRPNEVLANGLNLKSINNHLFCIPSQMSNFSNNPVYTNIFSILIYIYLSIPGTFSTFP